MFKFNSKEIKITTNGIKVKRKYFFHWVSISFYICSPFQQNCPKVYPDSYLEATRKTEDSNENQKKINCPMV